MTIPLWALFGFLAAGFSASQMLVSEKFRASPFPMAFWSKIACIIVMIPFVWVAGLPHNPVYYAMLVAQSLLWVISDVIFYRSINETGAAVISRVMPIAMIVSFFLWFALNWPSASAFLAQPAHAAGIIVILCLLAFFAWHLKTCAVTKNALRKVWFVLFAAIAGSISTKYITRQADISQGVYAYVMVEGAIMVAMWLIYYAIKKPVPARVMFGAASIKAGLVTGVVAACAIATTVYAVYHIDNPAYVSAMRYLDAVMILGIYKMTGRKATGHIWAGLGIVACAAALVILKAS